MMHSLGNGRIRHVSVALTVALIGASAVLLIVSSASLKLDSESQDVSVHYMLEQDPSTKARFQELWFGPGISDDLNRMMKIGQ
jgi:hypothetical protein